MINDQKVQQNCINFLKKEGHPIIIVAAVYEAEAIANACKERGILVSAICDSEKESLKKLSMNLK